MKNISKKLQTLVATAVVLILASAFTTLQTKTIDLASSKITWKGYKVTGEHYGSISFKSGSLDFSNEISFEISSRYGSIILHGAHQFA